MIDEWDIPVGDGVTIHGRSSGDGPPVVLLHGHPRTHMTWHRVTPLMADRFTVVCPDLRGYGRSSKPTSDDAHEVYCDRAMARDVVALMRALGHDRFAVAGHDRGQGVAYRTALDHPDVVTRLAVLDGVPVLEALERADARFATEWWHWFFFASPHAERVITADPMAWYKPDRAAMGDENYEDMVRAVTNPATVRAMLEDYRAGLTIDRANDEATRAAGETIRCDTLVAWSTKDDMEHLYGDPAAIWRPWVSGEISSAQIDSGHHMAEENPTQLAHTLTRFFQG